MLPHHLPHTQSLAIIVCCLIVLSVTTIVNRQLTASMIMGILIGVVVGIMRWLMGKID